jgi:hypothetical protein
MGTLMAMKVLIGDGPADEAWNFGLEMHNLVRELSALAILVIRLIHKDLETFTPTLSLTRPLNTHVTVPDLVFRNSRRKDNPEFDQLH